MSFDKNYIEKYMILFYTCINSRLGKRRLVIMEVKENIETLSINNDYKNIKPLLAKKKYNKAFFIKISICVCVLASILFMFISSSFAGLTPVESIVITSNNLNFDDNEVGAWKVTESAKWISKGRARVTLDIETVADVKEDEFDKDVLFIVETSNSISSTELQKIKDSLTSFGDSLLQEDSSNKVALISFNSSFSLVTDFTSNRSSFVNSVNSLTLSGGASYYEGLKGIDSILSNYQKTDKELVVLFIATSKPNQDMPNEVAQYKYLMNQYSYLNINAIQYDFEDSILETIKNISDKQYTANSRTLNSIILDVVNKRKSYDEFKIVNYINQNNFKIENLDSVSKVYGTASLDLDDFKVTFDLSDVLSCGNNTSISFDVILDETNVTSGIFTTHNKTEVISLINSKSENVSTGDSPVLADNYKVTYDTNAPSGCSVVGSVPDDSYYSVFDTVKIPGDLSCEGYQFNGWDIVSSKAVTVNTNNFLMPEEDVSIVATWSKVGVNLSMDGTIFVPQTLNNIIKNQAVLDNVKSTYVTNSTGIDFSDISSDTNGKGVYELSSTKDDDFPIYYYRGDVDNNNIRFGNFCWKIVRTTSTGGVKLIYNGVPKSDGSCNNSANSSQIGKSAFNEKANSISDVGYLFGDRYESNYRTFSETWYEKTNLSTNNHTMSTWYEYLGRSLVEETGVGTNSWCKKMYLYSKSISYNSSTGVYSLSGATFIKISSTKDSVGGYYTCSDYETGNVSRTSCTTVKYIVSSSSSIGFNDGIINYVELSGGDTYATLYEKYTSDIVYGSDVTYDEENNTYTLENAVTYKPSQWSSYWEKTKKETPYTCNTTSDTCTTVSYVVGKDKDIKKYVNFENGQTYDYFYDIAAADKYVYGNDVVYDDVTGMYTIVDTMESAWVDFEEDSSDIGLNRHYTCLTDGKTCSDVYYIYYIKDNVANYVTLSGGKLLNDITTSISGNTNESSIKTTIDDWYETNLDAYEEFLEDPIWCNDRSFTSLYGFDKDSNTDLFNFSGFSRASNHSPSLSCTNLIDSYTMFKGYGNGLLDYPIGLLTADELVLAGANYLQQNKSFYLYTGSDWWTMTPYYYGSSTTVAFLYYGFLFSGTTSSSYGVRPAISLRNGLMVIAGDGTGNNPYILKNYLPL